MFLKTLTTIGQTIAQIIASGIPFVKTVIPSTAKIFCPTIVVYSLPKIINISSNTSIVLVILPVIDASTSACMLFSLLLANENISDTKTGVRPASILGTKQITKLPTFPLYIAASENGVNKNAVGNADIINVQYTKLYSPKTPPTNMPTLFPKVSDAIITGTIDKVAAIGPKGIVSQGCKTKYSFNYNYKTDFECCF